MFFLRNRLKVIIVFCLSGLMITCAQKCFCEEYFYDFEVSPSFTSGDYGTGDNVDVFYLPFILSAYPSERIRGSVEVPWVYQSSTQIAFAGGMGHHSFQNTEGSRGSESGLGDIILKGEYAFLLEPMDKFNLLLEGTLKLPTASESKGLGTGEADEGIVAELGRTISHIYYYGRFGYTVVGEPSGEDFDNPFLYEGGINLSVNPGFDLTLSLEGSTSIDDNLDDPLEAVLSGNYKLGGDLSLSGSLLVGLSDGSPDFGLGVGFIRRF